MGFSNKSVSFTRFRLAEEVPGNFWETLEDTLKRFAFQDIDDIPEERHYGWTNFDDMLDTSWRLSPPQKGEYLAFSLRVDTRKIPAAVLKKHTRIAIREEETRIRAQGKKFVGRERKKELGEQVKLRLLSRFLPVPAEFQVVWEIDTGHVFLGATQNKILELFQDYFLLSFDLHLERLVPSTLALSLQGKEINARLDDMEPTRFVGSSGLLEGGPDLILGREFLTWLWYRSDSARGVMKLGDNSGHPGVSYAVTIEQSVVVQGGEGDNVETTSVSGSLSPLKDARMGLRSGKLVVTALVRLEKDGMDWTLKLKAGDFSIGALCTPALQKDEEDDPDSLFLEKMYLIDTGLEMLDDLYRHYLEIRLSPAWAEEAENMGKWMELAE